MHDTYANYRILVADDDPVVARLVAEIIRTQLGAVVTSARDGDDVLRILTEEGRCDVLVTDMLMPGCHGLPLISRVHRDWPDVSIVVMTAYPGEFPYVDVIRAGASDFVAKPFHVKEMEAKLIHVLEERVLRERVIQEKHRILEEVSRGEEAHGGMYRSMFELSMEGMLMLDTDGYRVQDVNRAFCELTGSDRDALLGRSFFDLFHKQERDRLEQGLNQFAKAGRGAFSGIALPNGGVTQQSLDMSVTFIDLDSRQIVSIACKDVTEQLQIKHQLGTMAQTDEMTGLMNYRSFSMELDAAITQARRLSHPLSLMFIDLDNFKQCNDSYGHQTGDAVLKTVGEIIREQIRIGDEGFRYGGDEFAVVLANATAEVAARVAERVQRRFDSAERYGTSMSIGITQYHPEMDATSLVGAADKALYQAKAAGKNAVCVV